MAGGRLEAAFKAARVWASFTDGMDAIVSWDPFFYDVSVYVRVSAGVDIEVCFFGCWASVSLSRSAPRCTCPDPSCEVRRGSISTSPR